MKGKRRGDRHAKRKKAKYASPALSYNLNEACDAVTPSPSLGSSRRDYRCVTFSLNIRTRADGRASRESIAILDNGRGERAKEKPLLPARRVLFVLFVLFAVLHAT